MWTWIWLSTMLGKGLGTKPPLTALRNNQACWHLGLRLPEPWDNTFLLHQSVQFSCSVISNFATHGLQYARLPCSSPTPRACSNSCPLGQWCHPTIASSVIPFSFLQSFPAPGCFPRSHFFALGGQSIGVSASASVLPMNIQDWFPDFDLLAVQGTLKSLLQQYNSKASILWHSEEPRGQYEKVF